MRVWQPFSVMCDGLFSSHSVLLCSFLNFYCIEFIGVILIHKIIQVSSVQLNKTPSVLCCIVHPLPQRVFPSLFPLPLCPPPPTPTPSLWLAPHCCLCLCVMYIWFLPSPFTFFQSAPPHSPTLLPSDGCQPVPCIHS